MADEQDHRKAFVGYGLGGQRFGAVPGVRNSVWNDIDRQLVPGKRHQPLSILARADPDPVDKGKRLSLETPDAKALADRRHRSPLRIDVPQLSRQVGLDIVHVEDELFRQCPQRPQQLEQADTLDHHRVRAEVPNQCLQPRQGDPRDATLRPYTPPPDRGGAGLSLDRQGFGADRRIGCFRRLRQHRHQADRAELRSRLSIAVVPQIRAGDRRKGWIVGHNQHTSPGFRRGDSVERLCARGFQSGHSGLCAVGFIPDGMRDGPKP